MTAEIINLNEKPFENRVWSHTAASACPQELLWIDKKKKPAKERPDRLISIDRRDRGSALHDFARLSLRLLFQKGKWPNAERTLQMVLKKGGGRDKPGEPLSFLGGQGYPVLSDKIGELLPKAELFQERFQFDADDRLGNEHFVAMNPDGSVASYWDVKPGGWRGRVDWAELTARDAPRPNQLKVCDFKNRPAIHPKAELMAHEQLSTYLWLLAQQFPQSLGENPLQGIYYFEWGVTEYVELTWDQVRANFERNLARVREKSALRLVEIRPEPGFGRCQYCNYISECPLGMELMNGETGAIVDMESAVAAGRSLFVMDELREATREGLKNFCEEHGPVALSQDTGWGFVEQPEFEVEDIPGLLAALKKLGRKPLEFLRFDREALRKAAKKDESGELQKLYDLHVKRARTKTPFKAFKPQKAKVVTTPLVKEKAGKKKAGRKKRAKPDEITVAPTIKEG